MLHVFKDAAHVVDVIGSAVPWILPYREPLRHLLADRSCFGASADGEPCSAIHGLQAARRAATLTCWGAGPEAWRQWSAAIVALRARFHRDPGADRLLSWLAYADFSDHSFVQSVDFGTLELPGGGSFARTTFAGDAWFSDVNFCGRVDFCGTRFLSAASFENSRFAGGADFRDVVFLQSARFTSSSAHRDMTFRDAEFCKDAWFRYSQFFGPLDFPKARIGGEAGFGNCLYAQDVDFSHVEFRDNAGFEQSTFGQGLVRARLVQSPRPIRKIYLP